MTWSSPATSKLLLEAGFGKDTRYWHGVDVTFNARTTWGLVFQGGTSTGRGVRDNCEIWAKLPELIGTAQVGSCHVTEKWLTRFRGLTRGFSRDLQFIIGYSYAHQWIEGTWDRNDPASFLQPEAFRNRKGVGSLVGFNQGQINSLAPNQTNFSLLGSGVPSHMLKVNVAYLALLGLAVGVSHLFQMGQYSGPILTLIPQSSVPHPQAVTLSNGRVVSNPLATRVRFFYSTRDDGQLQLPSLNVLNLRIGKRFKRGNHTFEGAFEVFNLFNQGKALAFDVPSLAEGQPAAFGLTYTQPPRAGLITARWAF